MDENMTMTTEVVETAEDIIVEEPTNKVGLGLAIGAAFAGIGILAYKLGKKCKAKIEARKAQKAAEAEANLVEVDFESAESDE